MTELDLIRTWFSRLGTPRPDVALGVGDDCALLRVPPGQEVAVSIDTLVSGTHFLPDCDPESLGHKALAVGLSDLAAMGAEPAWATLALTLPARLVAERPGWIGAFAQGLGDLALEHRMGLVGGDTTRGPLSVTVQVHGLVPQGAAIRRAGARPGDLIYVSGTLGDAGLVLRQMSSGAPVEPGLGERLHRPTPRVRLGMSLRGIATAMIDISDGLAADLGHILEASGVGAELRLPSLPLSPSVAAAVTEAGDWSIPLASGDDYELCFCIPPQRLDHCVALAESVGCALTRIGWIGEARGLICLDQDDRPIELARLGFDHFVGSGD